MPKRIDITGQKFGRLTVIERAETHYSGLGKYKGGQAVPMWRCICDCGNETTVRGDSLRCGKTKSCGCIRRSKEHIQRAVEGRRRQRAEQKAKA